MGPQHISAPEVVELVYRVVGKTHVFTSRGMQGLVHVGSSDRKTAYELVIEALNQHAKVAYDAEVKYKSEFEYEEFAQHLDGGASMRANFLTMTLDQGIAA